MTVSIGTGNKNAKNIKETNRINDYRVGDSMQVNIFIIHGTEATSESNWFPWLKAELEKRGMKTITPNFPIKEKQTLQNWLSAFEQYSTGLNEKTILVGHSIGPAFIMSLLERINVKISAAFLVAPFVDDLPLEGLESIKHANLTFVNKDFDWEKIKRQCNNFYVYASDNDPYVPMESSLKVARNLNAEFKLIKGAKHMNAEAGYLKFEQLLQDILSTAKTQ